MITGDLCGVEDDTGVCFKMHIYLQKQNKQMKTSGHSTARIFNRATGLGNNCPMLDVLVSGSQPFVVCGPALETL